MVAGSKLRWQLFSKKQTRKLKDLLMVQTANDRKKKFLKGNNVPHICLTVCIKDLSTKGNVYTLQWVVLESSFVTWVDGNITMRKREKGKLITLIKCNLFDVSFVYD